MHLQQMSGGQPGRDYPGLGLRKGAALHGAWDAFTVASLSCVSPLSLVLNRRDNSSIQAISAMSPLRETANCHSNPFSSR